MYKFLLCIVYMECGFFLRISKLAGCGFLQAAHFLVCRLPAGSVGFWQGGHGSKIKIHFLGEADSGIKNLCYIHGLAGYARRGNPHLRANISYRFRG